MLRIFVAVALLALGLPAEAALPSPYASAAEQQAAMAAGAATSEGLAREQLARIQAIDRAGPRLNSVLALNPGALSDARALDRERARGHVRGSLHGVAILLKDNIESADGTATTAGSLALADNITGRDAPVVQRLKAAGAVILGKANLSEWANFRSTRSVSGWSAIGGLTRNPYALDRSACGSSSGSAVAVAAGLAAGAIGTETEGSITCPAAFNGVVGLKPTLGLVSRTHVVPISPEQDTPGPIARTVADAAAILTVIAGSDPLDPATLEADRHRTDYVAGLDPTSLRGARLGVLRINAGRSPQADAVFEQALGALRAQGAVLVEVKAPEDAVLTRLSDLETTALRAEFRPAMDRYLAGAAPGVRARSLNALAAFDAAEPRETILFGQEIFEASLRSPGLDDASYRGARDTARQLARGALDGLLRDFGVDVLLALSAGPAGVIDPVNGVKWMGSPSTLPAVAGYPHLTVPMGYVSGLPVGLSWIGTAWSEARLLSLGYAFEQAVQARRDPQFPPSLNQAPQLVRAYDPR